jgi:hypothetical protein
MDVPGKKSPVIVTHRLEARPTRMTKTGHNPVTFRDIFVTFALAEIQET